VTRKRTVIIHLMRVVVIRDVRVTVLVSLVRRQRQLWPLRQVHLIKGHPKLCYPILIPLIDLIQIQGIQRGNACHRLINRILVDQSPWWGAIGIAFEHRSVDYWWWTVLLLSNVGLNPFVRRYCWKVKIKASIEPISKSLVSTLTVSFDLWRQCTLFAVPSNNFVDEIHGINGAFSFKSHLSSSHFAKLVQIIRLALIIRQCWLLHLGTDWLYQERWSEVWVNRKEFTLPL
jgi:hypothetical protein